MISILSKDISVAKHDLRARKEPKIPGLGAK